MRVRKSILVSVALIFLAILIVAPMRVYSDPSPVTVIVEMPDGYIPGEPLGTKFYVFISIDASDLTYDGPDGIIFWAIYVKTDPTVLKPFKVTTCIPGYFLYDFADEELYPEPNKVVTIDPDTGLVDVAEMFFAPLPDGGAATDGVLPTPYHLVRIGYEVMTDDIDAYTLIDIIDPAYTALENPEVKIPMEDVDGHYNPEPVPEFPLGAAVEIGLIAAVAYIWWTRRRKLKVVS